MATFGESENIHLTTLEFLWKQSPPGLAINSSSSTAGKMHPRSCSSSSGGSGNRRGRASLALRSYASAAANSQSLASGCRLEVIRYAEETILTPVVEYLHFVERVSCSVVSRTW